MCLLYSMESSFDAVRRAFGGLTNPGVNLAAYAEIYPNGEAPVLRRAEGASEEEGAALLTLEKMRFGLPPPGHKAGEKFTRPLGNIRNLTSPFWRASLSKPAQRCVVPVTRFCEWTREKGSKRKIWFGLKDTELFAFAGIWREAEDGPRMAFLTTEPNPLVRPIHAKSMPVILPEDAYDIWLNGDYDAATALAKPYDSEAMEIVEGG